MAASTSSSSSSAVTTLTTVRVQASIPVGKLTPSSPRLLKTLCGRRRRREKHGDGKKKEVSKEEDEEVSEEEEAASSKTKKNPAGPCSAWSMTPQLLVQLPVLLTLPPLNTQARALVQLLLHPSKLREVLITAVRSRQQLLRQLATRMPAELKSHLLAGSWRALLQQSVLLVLKPRVTPQLVLRFPMLVMTLRAPPSLFSPRSPAKDVVDAKRRGGRLMRSDTATFAFAPPLVSCRRTMTCTRRTLAHGLVQTTLSYVLFMKIHMS
jgi:hypothetical protein